jgi:hypothetical protein
MVGVSRRIASTSVHGVTVQVEERKNVRYKVVKSGEGWGALIYSFHYDQALRGMITRGREILWWSPMGYGCYLRMVRSTAPLSGNRPSRQLQYTRTTTCFSTP